MFRQTACRGRRIVCALACGSWLLVCAGGARGAIVGEYRVDDYTQHLWHFNEDAGSSSLADSVETAPMSLAVVGAVLGQPSASNFGAAIQTGNSAYADAGIQPISEFTWSDGAFTFEAIIRPDVDPLAAPNFMNIICGDQPGDLASRSWQLRLTPSGELEFVLLAGGVQSMAAALPSTGPDTAMPGQWYHLAAVYNGQEGTDGNLKLYWTLLDENRTEASLLAEFNMQADLAGQPQFVVGSSGRNPAGEGFVGLIDEVRISNINRYANEMQFVARSHVAPYGPDAYTMHLWHFDDPAGGTTVADSGLFTPIELTLAGDATLGNVSYEGFDSALQAGNNAYATGGSQPVTEFTGANGSFTFEAIIRPDVDPLAAPNFMNMICGENTADLAGRSWQFRLTPSGELHFILLAGGVQHFYAPLPEGGPNAAVAEQWYHVAATYNGLEATDGNLKLYWTLIDRGKTEAALLGEFNMQADLAGNPIFTIGTSGRNPSGEGFWGLIDEVRISNVDRYANDMLFTSAGSSMAPSFTVNPKDTLVGYGETLKLQVLVSGAQPMTYQWRFNDVNLPDQTSETLVIPDVVYEDEGDYSVVATNAHGSAVSRSAYVTVGAVFSELFNTGYGVDANGVLGLLPGETVDPHYILVDSNDPDHLIPDVTIWSDEGAPFPSYVINGPDSKWIGPTVERSNPTGRYVYRTTFVIDSADPCNALLEGQWSWNGKAELVLNGEPTGLGGDPYQGWRGYTPIEITEGFVPGLNTLDFVIDMNDQHGATFTPALRVELRGVGQALPAGGPVIAAQPENLTVRRDGIATLSVIASARAPLTYQWLKNGSSVEGATGRSLVLAPVDDADAGSYSVVVTNIDGSVTSDEATLTVVADNQPPVAATYVVTATQDQPVNISIRALLSTCNDPDGDALYFVAVEGQGTAGGTVVDPGGAFFTYTPPAGFLGVDSITYTIEDEPFARATGTIEVQVITPEN